jgi:transposase
LRYGLGAETLGGFHPETDMDISLRRPEDAAELSRLIREARDAKQRDRLRAIELAIAGRATLEIQEMLGRSRHFVQRGCYTYRDHGLGAVKAKRQTGRPPTLPAERNVAFKQRVLDGPLPGAQGDGVCTLRGRDCQRILKEEFGASYELQGVYDLLHRLNLSVLVPRPQHRKSDPEAQQAWVERAPFLSKACGSNTPTRRSPCGSRTKQGSANRAR